MKRGILTITLISVMFIIAILPFISAQSFLGNINLGEGIRNIIDQITIFVAPIFEVILGDYSGSEFFFAKVLLVILLTIIIHTILERMPLFEGYRSITTVIAIIVSILGIRFLQEGLIQMIILPYNTLVVALAAFLPFLIVAYGIYTSNMSGLGRKLCWIVFLVVFVVMWTYQSDKIGDLGNQIYLWTSGVIVATVAFDKRIKAYFQGADIKKFEEQAWRNDIVNLQMQLSRLYQIDPHLRTTQMKNQIRDLERKLKKYGAKYHP